MDKPECPLFSPHKKPDIAPRTITKQKTDLDEFVAVSLKTGNVPAPSNVSLVGKSDQEVLSLMPRWVPQKKGEPMPDVYGILEIDGKVYGIRSGYGAGGTQRINGIDFHTGMVPPNPPMPLLYGNPANAAAHVEVQAAALMHRLGAKQSKLYLNLTPCGSKTGAEQMGCWHNFKFIIPKDSRVDLRYVQAARKIDTPILAGDVKSRPADYTPFKGKE